MPRTTTLRRKPTRHVTAESRLRAMSPRLREDNPVVPLMLEMFDAARRNVRMSGDTPLARLYNGNVAGRIPQAHLDRLHRNVATLTPDLRARIGIDADATPGRLDASALANARLQLDTRIARGVAESLLRPRLPVGIGRQTPMKGETTVFDALGKNALADIDPALWKHVFDRRVIDVVLGPLPAAPVLDAVMPKKSKGYMPKEKVTLRVRYPDWANATFKVILSTMDDVKIDGQSQASDYATLTPKVLGTANPHGTRLHVALPADFRIGSKIRVQVTAGANKQDSNRLDIARFTVPAVSPVFASPELTAIKPADGQLPGRDVIIEGRNIGQVQVVKAGNDATGEPAIKTPTVKMACHVRLVSPNGGGSDVHLPLTVIKASPVGGIGSARFTLPMDIVPGDYWLQLVLGDAPGTVTGIWLVPPVFEHGPETLAADFRVKACKYAVRFDTMHCKDESDPETILFVDLVEDHLVTRWSGLADETPFAQGSRTYHHFDDGDTEHYDGNDATVFPVAGGFGEVRAVLGMQVDLWEWDADDVAGWTKTMDAIQGVATSVGELLLKLGQPKAAAIAAVVVAVAEGVSIIASLFEAPDPLGSKPLLWTAVELQTRTDNANRSFTGTLDFDNSDDDGSFRLGYTVTRFPE